MQDNSGPHCYSINEKLLSNPVEGELFAVAVGSYEERAQVVVGLADDADRDQREGDAARRIVRLGRHVDEVRLGAAVVGQQVGGPDLAGPRVDREQN